MKLLTGSSDRTSSSAGRVGVGGGWSCRVGVREGGGAVGGHGAGHGLLALNAAGLHVDVPAVPHVVNKTINGCVTYSETPQYSGTPQYVNNSL